MPVPRKVEPHPLERIDQFIKEQKSRRAAFWNRRDAEKAPGSIGKSLAKKGPGAPGARDKGKDNTDPKLWNPVNCAEHEVHAIRAIQARTEAIQRLAQCCERVDDHIASRGGFVCNSDPVLKMFFRLVGNVRVKTIDAVECVSSWERNIGRGRAFVHNGSPYLPALGEELRCLDGFEFVRVRVRRQSCADDPFLCDVTPLGVPIEPTSAFELRQGGRINQAALRLRMAIRTVQPLVAALRHNTDDAPAARSRFVHGSPTGRKSQARRGAGSRIPSKSKDIGTATTDSLEDPPEGPEHRSLLDHSHSRLLQQSLGTSTDGPRSGQRSAPSRLATECNMPGEPAAAPDAQQEDHCPTGSRQSSGVPEGNQEGGVCVAAQQDNSGAGGASPSGSRSGKVDAGRLDRDQHEHAPGGWVDRREPEEQTGEAGGVDPGPPSEFVLPLPPPGTAAHASPEPTRPRAAQHAADSPVHPDRVHLAIAATDRATVRVSPRDSHVRVTLSLSASALPHGSQGIGRAAGGLGSLEGACRADGGDGVVAADGQEGPVRLELAVVQGVSVHVGVAPHLAVQLRVARQSSLGRVGATGAPQATHERVRLQLVVLGTPCSDQGARDEVQGVCGGLDAHSGVGGAAAADGAEGGGVPLQHACSLDSAVNEVVEEMMEYVARELCPGNRDAGAGAGGVALVATMPAGRGSRVGTAHAAVLHDGAPGDSPTQCGGMPAAVGRVRVRLFVEEVRGVQAERPSEGRCIRDARLVSPGEQRTGSGAGGGMADGSSGFGEAIASSCAGEGGGCVSGGAGAVSPRGTGEDDRVQAGAAQGLGVVEDGRVLEARVSVTSVVVDEVVQELLADALAEGFGCTAGGVGAD